MLIEVRAVFVDDRDNVIIGYTHSEPIGPTGDGEQSVLDGSALLEQHLDAAKERISEQTRKSIDQLKRSREAGPGMGRR